MTPKDKWYDEHDEEQSLMVENCENDSASSTTFLQRPRVAQCRQLLNPSLSTLKDLVLIAFAILGFVSLLQSPTSIHHAHDHSDGIATSDNLQASPAIASCDCGNSTAEAVALGCKYDSLAAAWLPEHCRDDELTAEFERSGPGPDGKWTYWADTAHTKELSVEEIAKMGDDKELRFHMSGHWHVLHCIFYWRKEHRARFNGKMVEPRSDNEKHIKHCGNIFLDPGYGTVAGVALNTDME
ncbi:hypothetical protein LZ32DRAFT_562112 [Colletotrichum eremochloae]|nr:hypothetical protein LZ32DRAFT_562112 [Colletotrichum eremochloae]